MKILIIENGYRDLVKSRYPLGDFFISKGHSVRYACPNPPKNLGIFNIDLNRSKFSPTEMINALNRLKKIESNENIEAVLSFRFTSNVINYLASFFGVKRRRVAVITGLGYAFVYASTRYKILKFIIRNFYKLAEKRIHIVAQNPDDLHDLGLKNGKVILGSGISKGPIEAFMDKRNNNKLNLLFVGRLLKSKGIDKAVNLFLEFRKLNSKIELSIAGNIDKDNPDSISQESLEKIKNIDGVRYLNFVEDMAPLYKSSDILLFPSYYREGVPRTIIEALSFGLTIITTDTPGCKETILNNGIVSKKNFEEDALSYLKQLTQEELEKNKYNSLELFSNNFSSEKIYPQYLRAIVESH